MSFYFNDLNRRYQQRSIELVITDDFRAIEQNIDNILECPVKSFMFNRAFGARLRSFIFEPINPQTAASIRIYLMEAIETWEPRIYVDMQNSYVIPEEDQHFYDVRLIYVVKSTGDIRPYVRSLPSMHGR